MFFKGVALMLVLQSAQVLMKDCASYDFCIQNVDSVFDVFREKVKQAGNELQEYSDAVDDDIENAIRKLNEDISNGSEKCKTLHLDQELTRYTSNVFNECTFPEYPSMDPNIAKGMDEYIQKGISSSSSLEDQEMYCKYLVPSTNYICKGFTYLIGECDHMQIFKDLYEKPWLKCENDM